MFAVEKHYLHKLFTYSNSPLVVQYKNVYVFFSLSFSECTYFSLSLFSSENIYVCGKLLKLCFGMRRQNGAGSVSGDNGNGVVEPPNTYSLTRIHITWQANVVVRG